MIERLVRNTPSQQKHYHIPIWIDGQEEDWEFEKFTISIVPLDRQGGVLQEWQKEYGSPTRQDQVWEVMVINPGMAVCSKRIVDLCIEPERLRWAEIEKLISFLFCLTSEGEQAKWKAVEAALNLQ